MDLDVATSEVKGKRKGQDFALGQLSDIDVISDLDKLASFNMDSSRSDFSSPIKRNKTEPSTGSLNEPFSVSLDCHEFGKFDAESHSINEKEIRKVQPKTTVELDVNRTVRTQKENLSSELEDIPKEKVVDAVSSLDPILPSESTFPSGAAQLDFSGAMAPISLEVPKLDVTRTEREKCPAGSVATIKPMVHGAGSDRDDTISKSSSSLSVTSPRSKKTVEGKAFVLNEDDSVGYALVCHTTGGEPQTRNEEVNAEGKKVVRLPFVNLGDADNYSWKYKGMKWVEESPLPRMFYECRLRKLKRRSCPAIRHVDRDPADPSMEIVAYESEHNHRDKDY